MQGCRVTGLQGCRVSEATQGSHEVTQGCRRRACSRNAISGTPTRALLGRKRLVSTATTSLFMRRRGASGPAAAAEAAAVKAAFGEEAAGWAHTDSCVAVLYQ